MSPRRARAEDPPPGYEQFSASGAHVIAERAQVAAVREALRAGTLYDYAVRQYEAGAPGARRLMGRAPAYAIALPGAGGGTRVVVRHSRHGGLLAPLTGDRFLPPTRAPLELDAALRLRTGGVRTPDVVAYALYPAGAFLRRCDVVTREVAGGHDLAAVLAGGGDLCLIGSGPAARDAIIATVAELLRALAGAGARHPDLNAKNVLLAPGNDGGESLAAYVLDVDRVVFEPAGSPRVAEANARRLARSLRKLRARVGLPVTDDEIVQLAEGASLATRAAV